ADELVFPSKAGTVLDPSNLFHYYFLPCLEHAGLRRFRFHDLRHTFGSLLIQDDASLAYVRDQMGHSSIQVTVDIYGHLIPGANVSFVDQLDAVTSPQHSRNKDQSWNQTVFRKCFRMSGWEAGIRTPIRRSRVCSPTVRRPP